MGESVKYSRFCLSPDSYDSKLICRCARSIRSMLTTIPSESMSKVACVVVPGSLGRQRLVIYYSFGATVI